MHTNKITIPRQITMLLLLTVVLNIARVLIFHSYYFTYLFWNIFLAILPFVISSLLLWSAENNKLKKPIAILGGTIWLLLLPNAPYIVTDFIHIGRNHSAPLIYDTFLLFSSAWVGLLLGMYSINHIEKILQKKFSPPKTSVIIAIVVFIASFGIYLGRFLRFNSWDVFSDASLFFTNITSIFSQPSIHQDAYLFTLLSFTFIYVSYRSWKYSLN